MTLLCPPLAWDEGAIEHKGIGADNPPSAAPKAGGDKQLLDIIPTTPRSSRCSRSHRHQGGTEPTPGWENGKSLVYAGINNCRSLRTNVFIQMLGFYPTPQPHCTLKQS